MGYLALVMASSSLVLRSVSPFLSTSLQRSGMWLSSPHCLHVYIQTHTAQHTYTLSEDMSRHPNPTPTWIPHEGQSSTRPASSSIITWDAARAHKSH